MRTLVICLLAGLIYTGSFAQVGVGASGNSSVYNEKGDYFFKRDEFRKAIVYYNMAYESSSNNYYPILKKAEAYELLGLNRQAEECYKIAFDNSERLDNVYRLKYAIVLLKNNKITKSEEWMHKYNKIVQDDIKGANLISAAESRVKLYKDSTLKIVVPVENIKIQSQKDNILELYLSNISRKSNASLSSSELNVEGFSGAVNYPTLNNAGTVMYFVSDAAGGQGGTDIYKSRLIDGSWSTPTNVGNAINTSGNESFPLLHNDSILYFTSDGHGGYGGMDVFSVNLMYSDKKVVNLGDAVNSQYDDYNLFLSDNGMTGYLTSERPGKAEQGIYSVAMLNFKIKYSYQPRRRTNMEEGKVNLVVSNGQEYNIKPTANGDFDFSFQPEENYKLVIQHENIEVENVIYNKTLSNDKRLQGFLYPEPLQQAEIVVPPGMKYDFTAGKRAIDNNYKESLKAVTKEYQTPNENTISLTALAKELEFEEGEVYTIRFVRDETKISNYKSKEVSTLYVNGEAVNVNGESFFVVMPLKTEVNFNIQTDIESIKENFNPNKFAVYIDEGGVFEAEGTKDDKWMISMSVNTDSIAEVKPENRLTAREISIIPGNEYILTLIKKDINTGEQGEVYIPLTRGVKYNLSSSAESEEYKAALAEFLTGREGVEPTNEEVIDISFLSKEMELTKGEELSFNLMPVKQFGRISKESPLKTKLTLDGKVIDLTKTDKYAVNVPFNYERVLNIQTDIAYIQDNFEADAFTLDLDTLDILAGIPVDTTGLAAMQKSGYLSMSVNTNSIDEVIKQNQLTAYEVSIIPGKEYILTVSKVDIITGEETEIIVPLTRKVKYDFTSNPKSDDDYKISLEKFLEGREDIETIDGELIDISLLSKELQIKEGDEISFSLLPVKDILNKQEDGDVKSSLYLDEHVVEFTHIQKYTINVPLSDEGMVNIQTDVEYIQETFEPGAILLDLDTISFFSEIAVDTTGYGHMVIEDGEITDPVFDIVTVNFDLNKDELRPAARKTIHEEVVNALKNDGRLYVTIKGYTDGLGNAEYNKELSKRRAESVKAYLTSKGIGDNRIRTFSFGASQALEEGINWEDLSESELEKHRRVEIKIYLPE